MLISKRAIGKDTKEYEKLSVPVEFLPNYTSQYRTAELVARSVNIEAAVDLTLDATTVL